MCKLAPKTQQSYIRTVSTIAKYLGCSPDTANAEDLRLNQLHLVDSGTSPITLNAAITGQKFLFDVTRGLGDVLARMQSVRVPQCKLWAGVHGCRFGERCRDEAGGRDLELEAQQ